MKELPEFPTESTPESPKISLHFPVPVYDLISAEAVLLQITRSGLLRRILRWHYGDAPGRPAGTVEREVPGALEGKNKKLQIRMEEDDLKRLRHLADRVGLTNSGVLAILFFRWLGHDCLEP